MKLELEIPDDIGDSLNQQASTAGQELTHWVRCILIDMAHDDGSRLSPAVRLPDPPLVVDEIAVPVELPRSAQRTPIDPVKQASRVRLPDSAPIAE